MRLLPIISNNKVPRETTLHVGRVLGHFFVSFISGNSSKNAGQVLCAVGMRIETFLVS